MPRALLDFQNPPVTTGSASQSVGKSVNCGVKGSETAVNQTLGCILYGGQTSIHTGVIATLHLKILPQATQRGAALQIEHAMAVSKDLKSTALKPAAITVVIRPRK